MSNPTRTPGRKLKRWIDDQGLTQREMAVRLGISEQHMSGILCGRDLPSRDLAFRIEDETEGAVKARDFVSKVA